MVKIALKGYTRAGKDTVGQIMKDYLFENGLGVTRMMAFGDEMKRRFHAAFPEIPKEPKPREGYEQFGKVGRNLHLDMWVRPVEQTMRLCNELNYRHFIITDLRQPNEAKWCKDNGFIIVEVWSPDRIRRERSNGDTGFNELNESEWHLHEIPADFKVFNMFDLDFLKRHVIKLLQEDILPCENNS